MQTPLTRLIAQAALLSMSLASSPARSDFYAEGNVYPDPNFFNLTPFNPLNWAAMDQNPDANFRGGVFVGQSYPGQLLIGWVSETQSGESTTLISRYGMLGLYPQRFDPPAWPGGEGFVTVNGAWINNESLDVGYGGQGLMSVPGGSSASAQWARIGTLSTGGGTMYVTGTFSVSNFLSVGEAGRGNLTVGVNGAVTSSYGYIAAQGASSFGQATLSESAHWNVTNYLGIGHAGDGTLTLSGNQFGEAPSVDSGWASIGEVSGSHGVVNMANGSLFTNHGALGIGDNGYGELNVESDSTMQSGWIDVAQKGTAVVNVRSGGALISDGALNLGVNPGGNGTINVTGAGSTLTAGTPANPWNINVGNAGHGLLTVDGGGLVTAVGDFSIATNLNGIGVAPSSGTVNVNNGGTINVGFTAAVGGWWGGAGGGGILNVNPGGTMTVGNSLIVWTNDSVNIQGGSLSPTGGVQNNNGFLSISAGALSTPGSIQNTGTINLTGGTLTAAYINNTGTINFTGGTLRVNTVLNSLTNNGGTLSPGMSPGTATIFGNYAQNSPGRLQIELASPASYDKLVVSGNLAISGAYLDVLLLDGYSPAAGTVFDILDWGSINLIGGGFNIQLPALDGGLVWNTSRLYTTGVLSVGVPGDYNNNGTVDGADYIMWRKNIGSSTAYNTWRANFGNTSGSGAGIGAELLSASVPEPAALTLLAFGMCLWFSSAPRSVRESFIRQLLQRR